MSKRGVQLSDLPAMVREQATRLVSRDLARGNSPVPGKPVASQLLHHGPVTTWWRTASKGSRIAEVQSVGAGKDWIDLIQKPNGAIQHTRTDGADTYHRTREAALQCVRERLDKAVFEANTERREFLLRERLIA